MNTILRDNYVSLPLHLPPISQDEFVEFCRRNPELRAERTATGELIVMAPAESFGDSRNAEITAELVLWNRAQNPPGIVFGPSAGFTLPSGAIRSPDAAWIPMARWNALPDALRSGYAHLCPDFVVELMSPSDRLAEAQAKMQEYMANGARLGWLVDRAARRAYVYRPNQPVETRDDPAELVGASELPGFTLKMDLIF